MLDDNKRNGTYIDKLDRKIMPYVEAENWPNRYPAHTGIKIPKKIFRELSLASESLFGVFCKVLKVFKRCPDNFLDAMDIPKNLRPFLGNENIFDYPSLISRFDFILDQSNPGNIHMVELNADTPCAIVEAFYGNRIFHHPSRLFDPNSTHYDDLQNLFHTILMQARPYLPDGSFLVFSCFDDYMEDYGNTMFLKNMAEKALSDLGYSFHISFESFYDLKVASDGLYTEDGNRVNFLYRLHPLELLVDERSDDGIPIGEELLRLVYDHKLIMMNPIDSILLQNKGFQALVWNLMEEGSFFTSEESSTIRKYMLPSYFTSDPFHGKVSYIQKPIWGREGNHMECFLPNGDILESKFLEEADKEIIIEREGKNHLFQQFIPSKKFHTVTDEGFLDGYITLSCFVLNGKSSAYYSRFSVDRIAGVEAYWTPLIIE